MRASFSCWCDEYYNLKMLLIGELFRSKAILERRQAAVKNEPQPEISNNVVCAASEVSDEPAHTHILIRAFASRLNIL